MKKVIIILAIIVGLILCIFHNEVSTITFMLTGGGQKAEKILITGTPQEVKKTAFKVSNLKFGGRYFVGASGVFDYAAKNPNPEVLKVLLDNKEFMEKYKQDTKLDSIDSRVYLDVIYKKNAPEKVRLLLEHGYNPYKYATGKKLNAIDIINKTSNKIDPKVFDVIREYYRY